MGRTAGGSNRSQTRTAGLAGARATHTRHENTTEKIRLISKEAVKQIKRVRIEDLYMRTASRTSSGDDIGKTVAIDVTRSHSHAALEICVERKEALQELQRSAVKNFYMGTASRTRARDDVGAGITIHIACSHIHAAQERRVIGEEASE